MSFRQERPTTSTDETPMKTTDSQNPTLHWELFIRQRSSATQGVPPGKEALTWVANTVTLIWGERDALLVDTFLSDAQTTELADWIESKDRTLRTIYLTHGHADHFFGLTLLLQRSPLARAVARPNVVQAMRTAAAPDGVANNWSRRWPGQIPKRLTIAAELLAERFDLEGHEIRVIDTGHTDTDDTTALHIPSLGLLIAGDAIYNETHPFLVESDRAGRQAWLAAIDRLAAINPQAVVVGHGPLDPDCSPHHIDATRRYIRDFDRVDRETATARDLYDRMLDLYPNRINPGSLWGSALAAKREEPHL
jgi:glyoxylase-like metal-dependent hydrolase (beta-lactamase superfamily II)